MLATHRSAIMSHTCREVTKWPSLFNDWENFSSSEDAAATREAVSRAKLLQTPAKRSSGIINLTGAIDMLNLESLVAEFSASDEAGLGVYEDVWNTCAAEVSKVLPASFTVKGFLSNVWTKTQTTQEKTAVI